MLLLSPTDASTADACPQGVRQERKDGGDGEISWYSYATLARHNDTDWCYHRRVILHKPERQYVNWPKGDIHKKTVVKEWITRSCCFPEPRAEDGQLEHGYSGKKIPTKVYKGSTEPKQNQTWISLLGTIYEEPRPVRVDLTLKSTFRKTADGFIYDYDILNLGDSLTVFWRSAESDVFMRAIKEKDLSFPLVLSSKTAVIKASALSSSAPRFIAQELVLQSPDGREIFRMIAPAYVAR